MGGWGVLDSVKSQEIVTGGTDVEPLQAMEPTGQPPRLINNFGQTITVDYEKNRMRLSFDAVREYPAKSPLKFVEVIDGDAGMLETPQADGKTMQGTLDYQDEFTIGIKDGNGIYYSWPVEKVHFKIDAPVEAHVEQFPKYTDKDVHDLMAYLQTLK